MDRKRKKKSPMKTGNARWTVMPNITEAEKDGAHGYGI